MGWANDQLSLLVISASGTFSGIFVYSPAPGTGNLIDSVTAQAGTDPYGNAYQAGITTYSGPGSPLVNMSATLNYAVTTKMITGGAAASDVTGIASIQAAVRFPSNNAAETSPPLIAETLLIYTDGSIADALLTLSGFTGLAGANGTFVLDISASSLGSKPAAVLTGIYTFAAGTITLTPLTHVSSTGFPVQYAQPGLLAATPGDATLIPGGEGWRSLGVLGAHYTVVLGRYRIRPDNCVDIDVQVNGDGFQATSVSFANAMIAAARPVTSHLKLPMGTGRAVTAGDIWPIMDVTSAGVVTVTNQGTAHTFAACVRIPLD